MNSYLKIRMLLLHEFFKIYALICPKNNFIVCKRHVQSILHKIYILNFVKVRVFILNFFHFL